MAETRQWQQEGEGTERGRMFWLASELDPGEEARQRRLEAKRRLLMEAGVIFPADEGAGAMSLQGGRTCPVPPPPYVRNVSPRGGKAGKA